MSEKLKGTITITRRTNFNSSNTISFHIEDKASHTVIARFEMSLEDFAAAVTGLGMQPVELEYVISESGSRRIGKTVETKRVFIEHPPGYDNESRKQWVIDQLQGNPEMEGWELFDDGTRSQQNGEKWIVVLRRWVDSSNQAFDY